MQARIKKIIRILALTISIAFLAYTSISFTSNFLGFSEHMPIFTAHVPTPSMFPTIDQGDVIFVDTRMEFVDVMLNDIVVFDAPVGMTVHRMIGFGNDTLITQGDNNLNPDRLPVTEQMYVGSVIFVLENGSHYAVLILGCILGLFAHNTWLKVKRKRNTHTIADKGKSPIKKNRIASGVTFIVAVYAVPAFILFSLIPNLESSSSGPTVLGVLYAMVAYSIIVIFTIIFGAMVIIKISGDPDKMSDWLSRRPASIIVAIIAAAAVSFAFMASINAIFELEAVKSLIDTIFAVSIAVALTATFLLIGMWFSYKDNQEIHKKLNRIIEKLSGTCGDSGTPTDKSSKDDQKEGTE